jgi:hypothetical protein
MSPSADLVNRLLEKQWLGYPVSTVAEANPVDSLIRIDDLLWKYAPDVDERLDNSALGEIVLSWNK